MSARMGCVYEPGSSAEACIAKGKASGAARGTSCPSDYRFRLRIVPEGSLFGILAIFPKMPAAAPASTAGARNDGQPEKTSDVETTAGYTFSRRDGRPISVASRSISFRIER